MLKECSLFNNMLKEEGLLEEMVAQIPLSEIISMCLDLHMKRHVEDIIKYIQVCSF